MNKRKTLPGFPSDPMQQEEGRSPLSVRGLREFKAPPWQKPPDCEYAGLSLHTQF